MNKLLLTQLSTVLVTLGIVMLLYVAVERGQQPEAATQTIVYQTEPDELFLQRCEELLSGQIELGDADALLESTESGELNQMGPEPTALPESQSGTPTSDQ